MGDMSELRGLIVIAGFLGIFFVLLGSIPYQFTTDEYTSRDIDIPDTFEGVDLAYFADSWLTFCDNGTVDGEWYRQNNDDVGGYEMIIYSNSSRGSDGGDFVMHRQDSFWLRRYQFYNEDMQEISEMEGWNFKINGDALNDTWNSYGRVKLFAIENGTENIEFQVHFSFDEDAYTDIIDAWSNDDMDFYLGVGFDQTSTGYGAWGLIASFLFFQLPEIHPIINAILAVPIWIGVAYISYILILRAIGALFGGGA